MIKISILLPTKKRLIQLKNSLDSILMNTDCWRGVEVVLACDPDDDQTLAFEHVLKLKKVVVEKQDGIVGYYNALKDSFSGDVVLLWSDENLMVTPHWDTVIRKKISKIKYEIWVGKTFDFVQEGQGIKTSTHPLSGVKFSCYPIIPRKTIDVLGYILPSNFRSWGADLMIDSIMGSIGRIVQMDEISIQTFWVDKDERWKTYNEDTERMVKEGLATKDGDKLIIKIEKETERLKEALKKERLKFIWNDYIPSFKSFDY